MALVSDPERLPAAVLDDLVRSLRADLADTEEMITSPRGRVLDPASLLTAQELLTAAVQVLDRAGARTPSERAGEANLAYATLLAVIDLVKSHTDVPKVPPPRKVSVP